jgi:hypothetical protein
MSRSGGESRVDLWCGEERDQCSLEALGRDREHAADRLGVLGMIEYGVVTQ